MDQPLGKRIIVTGASNSGKSTLAENLAATLGVSYIELDALHWEPGWVEADLDVFRNRIRTAIELESWVLAGNYLEKQQDVSWPEADTIVFLDLGMPVVLQRCIRRSWRRWRTQETLFGGENRENFWEHLMLWDTEKSLIAHIVSTHPRRRRNYESMSRDPRWAHLTFIRLRSVEEVDAWLADVSRASAAGRESGRFVRASQ